VKLYCPQRAVRATKTLITFGNKLHVNYDTFETRAHNEQDKDLLTQSCKDTFDDDVLREFVLAKTTLNIYGYDEIARDTFCTAAWCLDLLIQASLAMVKYVFYIKRLYKI
jgi:hypothetical protein